MSPWDEKASDHLDGLLGTGSNLGPEDHYGFMAGTRWQREQLLSEETVERAARALYEADPIQHTWEELLDGWRHKPYPTYPHMVDDLMGRARAVLTAALGEEE